MKYPHRTVVACHHILALYGHWAVNDPCGSGSSDFGDLKFAPLGPILANAQATRSEAMTN